MKVVIVLALISALLFSVVCERIKLVTQKDNYHFFPLKSNNLVFNVKADENVRIVLTNSYQVEAPHYEIVLGGAGNTESYIRRDKKARLHEYKGSVLKKDEYQKFSISLDHSAGTLRVESNNDARPILYYSDPNYVPMSYFGLTTNGKSAGFWDFDTGLILKCAQKASIQKVVYEKCIQLTDDAQVPVV